MERRHRARQKISLLIEVEGRLSVLVVEKAMGVGDGLKRHDKGQTPRDANRTAPPPQAFLAPRVEASDGLT